MVNAKADHVKKVQALALNINASKGLQEVLRTNLGPKGTYKMLVGGAGQIKLTKDGEVLLKEMVRIQFPIIFLANPASYSLHDCKSSYCPG